MNLAERLRQIEKERISKEAETAALWVEEAMEVIPQLLCDFVGNSRDDSYLLSESRHHCFINGSPASWKLLADRLRAEGLRVGHEEPCVCLNIRWNVIDTPHRTPPP